MVFEYYILRLGVAEIIRNFSVCVNGLDISVSIHGLLFFVRICSEKRRIKCQWLKKTCPEFFCHKLKQPLIITLSTLVIFTLMILHSILHQC